MSIKFYLAILRQRLPYMLLVVFVFSAIGLVVAVRLPTTYETSAKLLVEGAQIPDALAASTVQTNAQEQLQVLSQRLMTRENLIEIARRHDVMDGRKLNPDQIVGMMRQRTRLRTTGGRNQATLMEIGFSASTPIVAANVVNDYVTLILSENARSRTEQAEGTQDFFEQEVERLQGDLEIQQARIIEFKNANSDALPDSLGFKLERQAALMDSIGEAERDKTLLADQRVRLISIFNATGAVGDPTESMTPEQRQLASLEKELAEALAVFSENNPKVVILRTRIEQLRGVVLEQAGIDPGEGGEETILEAELKQIDSRLALIDRSIEEATEELVELEGVLDRIPRNGIALESLEREYQIIENQYNAAVERLAKAQTGERIELLAKGQRISVVESASVPNEPSKPDRPMIAGGGVVVGVGAAVGLFLLLEMLNHAIRRPKELTTALGITPFAVIPYMSTRAEQRRRTLLKVTVISLGIGLIVAGAWAVHTYYRPLDYFVTKGLEKLGLDDLPF